MVVPGRGKYCYNQSRYYLRLDQEFPEESYQSHPVYSDGSFYLPGRNIMFNVWSVSAL